ncbi:uncharacterized protein LOC143611423 [Bidens hawaiensis]|uniref:uncharacterized protein LOC143611423 n=1 Tax=Bidens hawaiensis TaxID=980011 RepID=UPI004049CD78
MGNNYAMKWSKWVPAKCNIHAWRAEIGRLPSKGVLERRNVRVSDNICVLCEVEGKSVDHITTGCGVAAVVWEHVSRWCKVPPIYAFSVRDPLELHKSIKLGDVEKDAFHGIIVIACWSIWKARNNKVSKGIRCPKELRLKWKTLLET